MRRLRGGACIATGMALLALGVPVGTAGADSPTGPHGTAKARKAVVEPTGRLASPAAMRSGRLSCGDVITKNTTLTANIGPCAGNGIIIGADNITLNLNGHTVAGTGSRADGTGGIRLPNRKGVTVTGRPGSSGIRATVSGFAAGVVVNGGSGNTIENLNVRDNFGPDGYDDNFQPVALLGDGIVLFKSASNQIINNVVSNNGAYDGIGIFGLGSNSNLIQGNTVDANVGIPYIRNANGTGILINHFYDQPIGTNETISGNSVIANTVRGNLWGSGITSVGNIGAQISDNVVEDNGNQLRPDATYETLAEEYPANGIGVRPGAGRFRVGTNMVITNNVVNNNGFNGIFLEGSFDNPAQNRVEGNQVFHNGAVGIWARNGESGSLIKNNTTGFNYILDLFDQWGSYGYDCLNEWSGNTWGEVQPGAQEVPALGHPYGAPFENAYAPDCTTAGGSGPNPPAEG